MKFVYLHPEIPDQDLHAWRCLIPARAVNRSGRHQASLLSLKDFVNRTSRAQSICGDSDVLIIQNDLIGSALSTVQHWKARDKTVVLDIQKTIREMSPEHRSYPDWLDSLVSSGLISKPNLAPDGFSQISWGMKLVHGATVPSLQLEREWSGHLQVQYLPSFIDLNSYENLRKPVTEEIVLGWVFPSSQNQILPDHPLVTALGQLCKHSPSLKIHFLGLDPNVLPSLPIPENQVELLQPSSRQHRISDISRFDLAALPHNTERDDHFIQTRILEYLVLKIPWVSSSSSVDPKLQGFGWMIDHSADAWTLTLSNLIIELKQGVLAPNQAAYLYGIAQNIDEHLDTLLHTYRSFQP